MDSAADAVEHPHRPQLCPASYYCLEGTATNISQHQNFSTPQNCTEGYYCNAGSCGPTGTAPCPRGTYCPTSSVNPTVAELGKFARLNRTTVSSYCQPGYYSSQNHSLGCRICPAGYSCESEGTVLPRICKAGTYREATLDQRFCINCPQGTWSNGTGLTSPSSCITCSPGWVCGIEGRVEPPELNINNLCPPGQVCPAGTTAAMAHQYLCPGGYICPPGTKPSTQRAHLCPAGFYCFNGTSDETYDNYICEKGYFCPEGVYDAPSHLGNMFKCPVGTTSDHTAIRKEDCVRDCDDLRFCRIVASINPLINSSLVHVEPVEMARLKIDWRRKPLYLEYDAHFTLALRINGRPERQLLPEWFRNVRGRPESVLYDLWIWGVKPVDIDVQIEIFNGLYADEIVGFANTIEVVPYRPFRSNMDPLVKSQAFAFYTVLTQERFDSLRLNLPLNLPLAGNEEVILDVGFPTPDFKIDDLVSNRTEVTQTPLYWVNGYGTEGKGAGRDVVVSGYLPFFSLCQRMDSHIPLEYAIANPEPDCHLPDFVQPVEAFSVGASGVSDECHFTSICKIEEELKFVKPRLHWWDLSGWRAFSAMVGTDALIPVVVVHDRPQGGDDFYLPQTVVLQLQYYQRSATERRLVTAQLNLTEWYVVPPEVIIAVTQRNDSLAYEHSYTLHVIWAPLSWMALMNSFSFGIELYTVLFSAIGLASFACIFVFYLLHRMFTRLSTPPVFKFWSYVRIVLPSPMLGGFCVSFPFCIVLLFFYTVFVLVYPFAPFVGDYLDVAVLTERSQEKYRIGRLGAALWVMSVCVLTQGSRLFVSREADKNPRASVMWSPTTWRRIQMVLASVLLAVFLFWVMEFSYSDEYTANVFRYVILFKFVQMFVDALLHLIIKDTLMISPMMVGLMITEFFITVGASDFFDFLVSFLIELSILVVERTYIDPFVKYLTGKIPIIQGRMHVRALRRENRNAAASILEKKILLMQENFDSETIEPMLDSLVVYSNETIALLLSPIVLFIVVLFTKETAIPQNYGIKSTDLFIYLLFSVVIIMWQFGMDVLLLNTMELFHTWPVFDYSEFARYRFRIRKMRWKPDELEHDPTIATSLQKLDQLCFSSQFYFISGFHAFGLVSMLLGMTTMIRQDYSMFSDQVFPVICGFTVFSCMMFRELFLMLSDWTQLWCLPQKEDDEPENDSELSDIDEEYDVRTNVTSEAVRTKFLKTNKLWILHHLTSVLTPRSIEQNRSYLIQQYQTLINLQAEGHFDNPYEVSSDSGSNKSAEDQVVYLGGRSQATKLIAEWWVARARRHLKLLHLVKAVAYTERKGQCEQCGTPNNIHVEQLTPFIKMVDRFDRLSRSPEYQKHLSNNEKWRVFYKDAQVFRTRCRKCIIRGSPEQRRADADADAATAAKEQDIIADDVSITANRTALPAPENIVKRINNPFMYAEDAEEIERQERVEREMLEQRKREEEEARKARELERIEKEKLVQEKRERGIQAQEEQRILLAKAAAEADERRIFEQQLERNRLLELQRANELAASSEVIEDSVAEVQENDDMAQAVPGMVIDNDDDDDNKTAADIVGTEFNFEPSSGLNVVAKEKISDDSEEEVPIRAPPSQKLGGAIRARKSFSISDDDGTEDEEADAAEAALQKEQARRRYLKAKQRRKKLNIKPVGKLQPLPSIGQRPPPVRPDISSDEVESDSSLDKPSPSNNT